MLIVVFVIVGFEVFIMSIFCGYMCVRKYYLQQETTRFLMHSSFDYCYVDDEYSGATFEIIL